MLCYNVIRLEQSQYIAYSYALCILENVFKFHGFSVDSLAVCVRACVCMCANA